MTRLYESKHNFETSKLLVLPDPDMKAQMLLESPATIYHLARLNIPKKLNTYEYNIITNMSMSHKHKKCLFNIF